MSEADDSYSPPSVSHVPFTSTLSYAALSAEVERLTLECSQLRGELLAYHHSVDSMSEYVFHSLTGFPTVKTAREEFAKIDGEALFTREPRHEAPLPMESLADVQRLMEQQFPSCQVEIGHAVQQLQARHAHLGVAPDHQGRRRDISNFEWFLVPFMYIFGGVHEFMAEFLPGIHCGQPHFSRLLAIATPLVASTWAVLYYKKRDLKWLLENASPAVGMTRKHPHPLPSSLISEMPILFCWQMVELFNLSIVMALMSKRRFMTIARTRILWRV